MKYKDYYETLGVKIIEKSIPGKFREKNSHPAKRTFQAIRIEVNNEIEPLYNTIKNSITALNSKGRLCVITFHSLEDRGVSHGCVRIEKPYDFAVFLLADKNKKLKEKI